MMVMRCGGILWHFELSFYLAVIFLITYSVIGIIQVSAIRTVASNEPFINFTNNNKDILSISTETNRPIFGNNSLRVDVKPGNDTTNWNTISTDFIPINENAYYNTSLYISAKDVNQLHPKITYFDSNKKQIKSVFVSGGRDGTFEAPYNLIDSSPNGTKYMQLQIWVGSNPSMSSNYLIDNVKIEKEHVNSSSMWVTGTNMPYPRTDFAGASLNEKIYIIGGFSTYGETLNTVEYYDPKTDTWSTASPLPEQLDHAAAAVYNGTLYVVGGYAREDHTKDGNPSDRLFIYNASTDKWDEGKSMPKGRGALTANFINGTLYAVGGVNDLGLSDSNTAYDPQANEWTEKTPMPTAREHLTSTVVDGKLYVIGGRVGGLDHNLDANQVYDPVTDKWSELESMPSKRGGIASAALDKMIYVFGGEGPDGTFNNNEKYDPNANNWTSELRMPTARHGLVAAAVNDRIYVVGGGFEVGLTVSSLNEIFIVNKTAN